MNCITTRNNFFYQFAKLILYADDANIVVTVEIYMICRKIFLTSEMGRL